MARPGGNSELGAVARWGIRNCERRRCLRPCGGICVLQACSRTCLFVCTVTDFSAGKRGASNFACVFEYYPDRSFPILNFGSLGVTVAVLLRGCSRNWPPWHGHSELGAAALLNAVWWDLRLASLLTHLLNEHKPNKCRPTSELQICESEMNTANNTYILTLAGCRVEPDTTRYIYTSKTLN